MKKIFYRIKIFSKIIKISAEELPSLSKKQIINIQIPSRDRALLYPFL